MRPASAVERCTATANTASTRWPKVALSRSSWAKACTVRISCSVSSTWLETSATRSCTARDSPRTRRPRSAIGSSTSGMPTSASAVSFGLVTKSITAQPAMVIAMRSA